MITNATSKKNLIRAALLIGIALILAIIACSFDAGSLKKPPDDTDIARSVEETLKAEKLLTEQALPTVSPPAATALGVSEATADIALQTQQAMMTAQTAEPGQTTPTDVMEAAPTETSVPTSIQTEPIRLLKWKARNMREAPGCGEDKDGPPCWFGTEDELELIMMEPIHIDSAWGNPHLTFNHKYVFVQNATIYLKVDSQWRVLWSFVSGQTALWQPFDVDLSEYKGKDIFLQFTVSGTRGLKSGSVKRNEWFIRDIRIVPNFGRN